MFMSRPNEIIGGCELLYCKVLASLRGVSRVLLLFRVVSINVLLHRLVSFFCFPYRILSFIIVSFIIIGASYTSSFAGINFQFFLRV